MNFIEDLGDFKGENFADNHYIAYIKNNTPASRYIILAATETTKQLIVPFSHRIVKIEFRQTDSANADSNLALKFILRRDVGAMGRMPLLKDTLFYADNLVDATNLVKFGDGFEHEETNWTIAFTGTATNRVHILVYLQRIGAR